MDFRKANSNDNVIIAYFYGRIFKTRVTGNVTCIFEGGAKMSESDQMLPCDIVKFAEKCDGFSIDEQRIVASKLDDGILVDELAKRLRGFKAVVEHINSTKDILNGVLANGK